MTALEDGVDYKAEIRRLTLLAQKYGRISRWLLPLMYAWPAFFLVYCFWFPLLSHGIRPSWLNLNLTLGSGLGAAIAGITLLTRTERLSRQIEGLVEASGNRTLIGYLCLMLRDSNEAEVRNVLTSVLPLLQRTEVLILDTEHRQILNSVLARTNRAEDRLRISILKAWEQIGDSSALPFVQRLAAGNLSARRNREIHRAAQKCLAVLPSIVGENDAKMVLLRPLQHTDVSSEDLLRPLPSKEIHTLNVLGNGTEMQD